MGIFSSISKVVGVVSGIAGIYGSVKGVSASKDAEKSAEERAKELKAMASKEYVYNIGELKRGLNQNMADMFMEQAKNRYNATQGFVQQFSEDYYAMSVRSYHSGGVAEMSATWDMLSKNDNELESQLTQIDRSIAGMEKELILDYNANTEQLGINKEKMEQDIGHSLTQGLIKADATKWSSYNTGLKSAMGLADVLDEYSR